MCKDEMGQIWAGGYGTGVYCINKHTGIKQHLTKAGGILTTDYVYSIVKDQDDELWIGGMFGNLVRYSPAKADKPAVYETYNVSFINSISVVSKDTVALATIKGFYLLNKRSGYFRGYFMSPSDLGIQSNSFIQCLYFEKPNLVWFGTDGGGLNRMNLETGDVVNLSESDGLPSNYIYGIVPDDEGRIWVSTDKGLAYLVSTQPEVMRMELLDGISNDFSLRSYTKLQNGDLIWGSADGVIRFTPKEMDVHSYKAPLHFISFEVPQCSQERNGMISGMLNRGETINLRYDENTFLISFISVSYQYQKDIQYRYILENFDQEWSELVEEPDARYTNIPPGNYVFRVQSVSKNGKFQLDDQEIHIYIAPPYWNTLAAWIVYFVVCVGISYFVWRFFINKMEKKHFQEKIQFFINTAHDIRTPVALIMAPLCDLSRNANWSEKEKKYLQIARNNTEKLSKMIEQLLEFQRIEGTYLKLNVGEYDLKQYLKDKVAYFLPMCENKRITMHLQLPDSAVLLWLDKDKTDKIFDNLLSNAIKYTGINGKIWITVVQTDKKVMVEIKDNGIGIPLKAQKHVFTNFYRAENAVNSRETGSGIGLLLVRRLMKRYKGEVSFTSKENEGTKFTLTFRKGNRHLKPYSTLSPSRSSESLYEYKNFQVNHELCSDQSGLSLATTENGESGRKRILIIEDNDDLRFYLKETFIPIYDVIAMPDGESAMGYLHENLVDLIISDIMMPGIQGDELCKQLKSKLRTSHIPIILLTAKAEKEFVIGGLEGGADDYVTKPFDVEVLVAKVKAILQNRSMLHQYFQSFFKDDVCSGQDVNDLPSSPCLSTLDKDFLQHCTQYILENLSDEHFTINQLCQELAMSRTLFYEKLKALTGQAPNDFIKSIRMKEAVKLLKEKKSVSEVAMKVGFADTKYFSTVFKKCFGVSPSKYQSGF